MRSFPGSNVVVVLKGQPCNDVSIAAPNYSRKLIRYRAQLNTLTRQRSQGQPQCCSGPSGRLQEGGCLVQIWGPVVQGLAAGRAHGRVDGSHLGGLKILSATKAEAVPAEATFSRTFSVYLFWILKKWLDGDKTQGSTRLQSHHRELQTDSMQKSASQSLQQPAGFGHPLGPHLKP